MVGVNLHASAVIAPTTSLASGPASQLLQLWAQDPRSSLVLTKGMAGCSQHAAVAELLR